MVIYMETATTTKTNTCDCCGEIATGTTRKGDWFEGSIAPAGIAFCTARYNRNVVAYNQMSKAAAAERRAQRKASPARPAAANDWNMLCAFVNPTHCNS